MFKPLGKLKKPKTLWRGPLLDGVTYTLLCKWLVCRERFRLRVIEGLVEPWGWRHQIHYGSMFHECLEAYDGGKDYKVALEKYYAKLLAEFPANERDITKWYMICKMEFPLYISHWRDHESERGRKSLFEERPFRFQYDDLPVCLRGKIDSVFERNGFIYVLESKTKGDIDGQGISQTIDQNLQTMIYHCALRTILPEKDHKRIAGTVYNVVRRPLSDRFALRQGKKETLKVFLERVSAKIKSEPDRHFFRWTVPVMDRHLNRFKAKTLTPILYSFSEWWKSIEADPHHPESSPIHFQFPYGVYNDLGSGFRGDYFTLLTTGSKAGLERVTDLFPEIH